VSEVQGEGNVTVYSDVGLSYRVMVMLLCTVMCVCCTGWRKVTVYSDVYLSYRVMEMLLCTVMCV